MLPADILRSIAGCGFKEPLGEKGIKQKGRQVPASWLLHRVIAC